MKKKVFCLALCLILVLGSISICFASSSISSVDDLVGKTFILNSFLSTDFYIPDGYTGTYYNITGDIYCPLLDKHFAYVRFDFTAGKRVELRFSDNSSIVFPYSYITVSWTNEDYRVLSFNSITKVECYSIASNGAYVYSSPTIVYDYFDSNSLLVSSLLIYNLESIFNFACSTIGVIGNAIVSNTILLIPCVCGIAFVGVLLLRRLLGFIV